MKFDLICIDMFQTLVDVDTRIPFIWEKILRDKYSEEAAKLCAKHVSSKIISKFHETLNKSVEFYNLRTLFAPCFEEIAADTGLGFDSDIAADIFLSEHGNSSLYDDSLQFFNLMDGQIPICLVSDADNVMIEPLLSRFKFDSIFISETVGSYKNEPESRIFSKVIEHYQVEPNRVLHIGDSSSDVIGAKKIGIRSCWINRNGIEWQYGIKPDYTIKSLIEVIELVR